MVVTLVAMLNLVMVRVGVGAVTVTTGAVVLPWRTVIGGGVLVVVVSVVSVTVAVVAGAVLVVVMVGQSLVLASVTMSGCGSGARAVRRAARASTNRFF